MTNLFSFGNKSPTAAKYKSKPLAVAVASSSSSPSSGVAAAVSNAAMVKAAAKRKYELLGDDPELFFDVDDWVQEVRIAF
jgi:branched-subunit amino acid aminotransferase/4-amino-4-deoxychorismate lyase